MDASSALPSPQPRKHVSGIDNSIVAVAAFDLSGRDRTDVPITFGHIFKQGDVPQGVFLQAIINHQPVPLQVDRKAAHGDGSLRHAVITIDVPHMLGSGKRGITLVRGSHVSDAGAVTLNDLLATSFDAQVTVDVGGHIYTASARNLLEKARAKGSCIPWGKQCNLWLHGSLVSQWNVSTPLRSPDGHSPLLSVRFYVRAYAGKPIDRVRVNVVVENTWSWVPDPHNVTYDITVSSGDQKYSLRDITHYRHSRWHGILWWGKPNAVYVRHDGEYIQASKAVSHYADVHPTNAFLKTVIQRIPPMDNGDQTLVMSATGAQSAIGPLPRWTTAYLLSMDQRAFRWMLANDDAAGSYSVFYRDKETGRPVTIQDYPYMTLLGNRTDTLNPKTNKREAFPKCNGNCQNPNVADAAHQPSVGYLSYIVTGDFYYLEQLQFWANWDEILLNPNNRRGAEGLLVSGQVRGQAWTLRQLADAAYITPDDAPLKEYFVNMVRNNIAWYNRRYTDNPKANNLGVIVNGYAIVYDRKSGHEGPSVRLAPWQDQFFTWMIGHLVDLGFDDAKRFLQWKAKFPVGLMTKPYCYVFASAYTLEVRDGENSPLYSSFGQVWDNSFPQEIRNIPCGSSEMAAYLRHRSGGADYKTGDMVGYPWSNHGRPAQMQPALAAAVDANTPGALKAWKLFISQPTRPDYSNNANFAVTPRVRNSSGVDAPEN